MKSRTARRSLIALATALACAAANGQQTLKTAFIDQLSGPLGDVGELMQKHLQFAVDDINAKGGMLGGMKMELLSFDNKLSAQEAQIAFKSAVDAGVKVIFTGGSGSSVVAALIEAANKHNERNPDRAVLIVNHSSIDPDLTGKNCSFWHFAVEANTAMKMKALTNFMKETKDIKKVFLLNQDYAHGRAWAKHGREMLAVARPDVQIVGEDFHPIGKVKDFAPYVTKIRATGADTVITGNWGADLNLLLKAAGESGANLRFFNHSAGSVPGTATAVAQARTGRLTWVAEWHGNVDNPGVNALAEAYRKRYNRAFLAPRIDMAPRLIAAAVDQAKSADPVKIALALESMSYPSLVGEVRIRKEDHQALLPQTVSTLAPVDGKTVKTGAEGTNIGFHTDAVFAGKDLALPGECRMTRPLGI